MLNIGEASVCTFYWKLCNGGMTKKNRNEEIMAAFMNGGDVKSMNIS